MNKSHNQFKENAGNFSAGIIQLKGTEIQAISSR